LVQAQCFIVTEGAIKSSSVSQKVETVGFLNQASAKARRDITY
jgi:hypothetical protein